MVELGIVIVLFILLVGGVMQFGQAFMVVNMITHAARDGARLAASWTNRSICGKLQGTTGITDAVNKGIATVTAQTFTVAVAQNPVPNGAAPCATPAPGSAPPVVTLNVNGCVPYIFNILGLGTACPGGSGNGFNVNRTVTFDDEFNYAFGG